MSFLPVTLAECRARGWETPDFVYVTGDIMTMPGLPRVPAAEKIDVDENGKISGLF